MTDIARSAPCTEPERRHFDLWIGDWDVLDPEGRTVGHNRITPLFDGCAIREEWEGVSGHRGTSLNAWSPDTKSWSQTWVDSSGLVLRIEGGLRPEGMVMEGTAVLPGSETSAPTRQRITWSLIDGDADRVRQHWEVSEDGSSWRTVFDGRYRRRPAG